jgi:hypothetical protein
MNAMDQEKAALRKTSTRGDEELESAPKEKSVEGDLDSPSSTAPYSDQQDQPIPYLAPIRSTSRHLPLSRPRTLHSIRSERSYGGEDGYSCFREDPESPNTEDSEEKRWEVKWEGEHDPSNPRNREKWKKWCIVLIMASSALCV